MSTNAKRFNLYVIELDEAILKVRKFRDANPDYDPAKPCVYVGMTARSPEERFQQHLSGYKAARFTKHYGIRLRPRLYQRFNPLTFEQARYMETELARRLRKRGYGVWQN